MTWIEPLVLLLVGAAVYAEVKRGLLFALFDVGRLVVAVGVGLGAYLLVLGWTRDYLAGAAAFVIAALLTVAALAALVRWMQIDPAGGKKAGARVLAGVIGATIGLATCLFLVPVLGNLPTVTPMVSRSLLARPFLAAMPALNSLADGIGIDLPQAGRGVDKYEDEWQFRPGRVSRRVNFTRLDGSTCIACRDAVQFQGYFRTRPAQVSPKFECPQCSRTSDGCQTFEGFHQMYGRCPIQVSLEDEAELDCGVWPNDKPVRPSGDCPVCHLYGPW